MASGESLFLTGLRRRHGIPTLADGRQEAATQFSMGATGVTRSSAQNRGTWEKKATGGDRRHAAAMT